MQYILRIRYKNGVRLRKEKEEVFHNVALNTTLSRTNGSTYYGAWSEDNPVCSDLEPIEVRFQAHGILIRGVELYGESKHYQEWYLTSCVCS